jgi:hypothetical protein
MKSLNLIADNIITGFICVVAMYANYHKAETLLGISISIGILWIFFLVFKYTTEY